MKKANDRERKLVLVEIEDAFLRLLHQDAFLEEPLTRTPDGLLTDDCVERLQKRLQEFLGSEGQVKARPALCALGARGISLRRFVLPSSPRQHVRRLLALQMERDLPLPPEALAWDYTTLPSKEHSANPKNARCEYLVAAIRREVVEQYKSLLAGAGLQPQFTLSALVLSAAAGASPAENCAILSVGLKETEWTCTESGLPVSIRTIHWGKEQALARLAQVAEVGEIKARRWLEEAGVEEPEADSPNQLLVTRAIEQSLTQAWNPAVNGWVGRRIYVAAPAAMLPNVVEAMGRMVGGDIQCGPVPMTEAPHGSPVLRALRHYVQEVNTQPALLLQRDKHADLPQTTSASGAQPWVVACLVLLAGLVAARYLEPLTQKSRLETGMAAMQRAWEQRPDIDHELAFLQYLGTNQPPYLDVLATISEAAAKGTLFNSLSLNRRGEMSLQGVMPNSRSAGEFRSKLIASGWFGSIVLEEQAPVENQQKVNIRLSGHWHMTPQPAGTSQETARADSAESPDNPSSPDQELNSQEQ